MSADQEQYIKVIKDMADFALCDLEQPIRLPNHEGIGVFVGRPWVASCSCACGGTLTQRPVVLCFRKGEDGDQEVCLETFYNLPKPESLEVKPLRGRKRLGLTVIAIIETIKKDDKRYTSAKELLEEAQTKNPS